MAIWGITGLPGAGKSLYAVHLMEKLQARGKRVLSNFHTRGGLSDFALWNDMKMATNAACIIDEAQTWFPSRFYKEQSKTELSAFQQHRKRGLDLYWIAQHEDRVDVALRELTAGYFRVNRLWRFGWATLKFPEMKAKRDNGGVFPFWHSAKLYRSYWSAEIIGDRNGEGYELGESSLLAEDGAVILYRFEVDGQTFYRDQDAPDLMACAQAVRQLGGTMRKMIKDPVYGMMDAIVLPRPSMRDRPAEGDSTFYMLRDILDELRGGDDDDDPGFLARLAGR